MAPRTKRYRRYLKFYATNFSILPPFSVLVDGNFLHHAATKCGLATLDDVHRIVATVLEAPFSLVTTHAVVREVAELNLDARTVSLAKHIQALRVGQSDAESRAMDAREALQRLVGSSNRHKYVVATQDDDFKSALARVPGVPVIGFQQVVLVLEAPSRASVDAAAQRERRKMEPARAERKVLRALAAASEPSTVPHGDEAATVVNSDNAVGGAGQKRKRRKGVAGPNPLSVLKPKARGKPVVAEFDLNRGSSRKRRRKVSSGRAEASSSSRQAAVKLNDG